MSNRSHFLSMLSQTGWARLELVARNGQAWASLSRGEAGIDVDIWEHGKLLAHARCEGSGARALVGSLAPLSGAYVDMFGEDGAWARCVEALMSMEARNVGMSDNGLDPSTSSLPTRKIDAFGKARKEGGES